LEGKNLKSRFQSFKVRLVRGDSLANTYRDLLVWQKAKALAVDVYRVTERFPEAELFGLTSQMRRAAVSVASNIAEGQGRGSKPDFAKFLCISRGSLLELETQLEIARELGIGNGDELANVEQDCFKVLGLLNRLLKAIDTRTKAQGFQP
jgi:four helix bundle protein